MKHVNVALFLPNAGCPHRCVFCDQHAVTGEKGVPTPDEIDEACRVAANAPHDPKKSEVAFFGGSFTALDKDLQRACLAAAAPWIENGQFAGVRVSTRPDAIDEETLSFLKEYRVTAVELGAQSTCGEVLRLTQRGHTREDVFRASRLVKAAGFSLGLQMMTALPGATDESDLRTALDFISLSPDTVRIYPTLVLKHTPLAGMLERGDYVPPDFEKQVALCAKLLALFEKHGVKVIRLGLHPSKELEENLLAGAYHPALRELAESRLYRDRIAALLEKESPGHYIIYIKRGDLSKAVGQKKENLNFFAEKGFDLRFVETENEEEIQNAKCKIKNFGCAEARLI